MSYPRPYGDYTLLEHLGAGGMSQVELARRTVGAGDYVRFTVIKRVLARRAGEDSAARMFMDEARINSELHHENIAQVYDFGFQEEEFYLAMEYVPGMDLRVAQKALRRLGRRVPIRVVLTVLDQVLAGLSYAHGAVDTLGQPMRIVHRDINPRNVMLSTRGDVKIIDFGLAKAENRLEQTQSNVVKGKFSYMAPEQIEGRDVDGRTDLFALGLMLQELVNGEDNFAELSHVQIVHRVLSGRLGEFQPPEDCAFSEELHEFRNRALMLDPEERFQTALEMRKALAEVARVAGEVCTRDEMVQFMRTVDADGISAISERLVRYRNSEVSESLVAPKPRPVPPDLVLSESIDVGSRESSSQEATEKKMGLGALVFWMGLAGLTSGGLFVWATLPDNAGVETEVPASVDPSPAEIPREVTEPVVETEPLVAQPPDRVPVQEEPPERSRPRAAPATKEVREPRSEVVPEEPKAPDEPIHEPVAEPVTETPPVVVVEPEVSTAQGYLYVASRPDGLEVRVDGKAIGRTPIKLHKLPVGLHEVVVVDPATGKQATEQVSITEGRPAKVMAKLE